MSDSSSAWRFSSNQSNTNAPHPEVRLEDTMANDPWSIWRPELSKETHVSVLPPNPIPQTSPPAELPRQGLSIPMILEYTKGEGSILLEISGREVLVPLDKKTGMNEAQKKRHRNAEASARSRKKRALKMEIIKKLEEARRLRESKEKDEEPREIKEETQTIEREIAKKLELLEDEELEKKHLAQLEDKAVPEEMSYAPDATLLGATYDPIFNPFLTPDYYLTGDHCATDPTELYWDCIQSLYTEYE
ncbi:hypothetical protein E4U57_000073 [Claviceps arundinis]|uniref:BZIP domain-containing protein n=1 Tax=Claviceps arundinis TaxID=1623583 RepID=A0ABQ7PP09_9HYPO|nr:hypothetical protein E4U57_000073 [Claviceps arundinis]